MHDVPRHKIVERYWRSIRQMPWFLDQADRAWIYDNSGSKLALVAEKKDGVVYLHDEAVPAIAEAVRSLA